VLDVMLKRVRIIIRSMACNDEVSIRTDGDGG